jgi:hypothetical protein
MKKLFTVFAAILLAMVLLFAFQPQETHAELYIETNDVVEISETDELYLNLSHDGKFIVNNSEEPILTVYIPQRESDTFPVGAEIRFAIGQIGYCIKFEWLDENPFYLRNNGCLEQISEAGVVTLKKIDQYTWYLFGDLDKRG